MDTYTRRQNDRRRGVVEFGNVERLSEEVGRIELVERDCPRSLGGLSHGLRRHQVWIGDSHSTELLGHLCDWRGGGRPVSRGSSVHLSRVCVGRLLVSRSSWCLRRVSSIATTAR